MCGRKKEELFHQEKRKGREERNLSLSPLPLLLLSLIFPPSLPPPGFIFFPNAAAEKKCGRRREKEGRDGAPPLPEPSHLGC